MTLNGFSLELSAQIFATLAVKTESSSAFAVGSQFAVARSTEGGATILLEEDLRENLTGEFEPPAVEAFLSALQAGRLSDYRYVANDGGFRTSPSDAPRVVLFKDQILSRMDPLSQEMKGERPSVHRPSLDLTRGMIHLYALQNIGRAIFEEAVSRVMSGRRPEKDDLLWLHAGDGQLKRTIITHPLRLTANPPFVDHSQMYGRGSIRFPVVTLEFHEGAWQMKEQYVYGSLAIREAVLSVLVGTKWPVRFVKRPKGSSHRPPPPQQLAKPGLEPDVPDEPAAPAVEIPKPPRMPQNVGRLRTTTTHYPVADFFFDNDWAFLIPGRGRLVSMTQPHIRLTELEQIPIGVFHQAVEWALGRVPRNGDRLAFTAGNGFRKEDKLKHCLILCEKMPASRRSFSFPKVWMERRNGEWIILASEITGNGADEMAEALVTYPPWNLTKDAS